MSKINLKSWLTGYALGLAGKPLPLIGGGNSGDSGDSGGVTHYLYNGVELPDINAVWADNQAYPYASIVHLCYTDEAEPIDEVYLYLSNNAGIYQDTMKASFIPTFSNIRWYILENGDWILREDGTNVGGSSHILSYDDYDLFTCVWTSYDVLIQRWNDDKGRYDETSEVYFAASDPVPVRRDSNG